MDFSWWFWALTLLAPPILFLVLFNSATARRQRTLDRLEKRWSWLGPASPWQGEGRAFCGTVGGRSVQVTWFEHNTEIEVDAHPHTEVGFGRVGQPEALAAVAGGARVLLDGRVGYGPNAHAVRAIDACCGAGDALATLLGNRDQSLRAVRIDPEGRRVVWFARNLPERSVTPDDAHRWVDALMVVAHASEHAGEA